MPPPLLFDTSGIDFGKIQSDVEHIERVNPHRGVMRLLDGVIYMDADLGRIIAYHDVLDTEFWVEGHIPGRPLMPGVLIIEAMAQVGGLMLMDTLAEPEDKVVYFMSLDNVKWRKPVIPGDQLVFEITRF